jgi:CBS domain-containing protein
MRSEDIMKRDLVFTREDETVLIAAQLMRKGNIGFLPVVDKEGKAVGVITDRDITIRCAADDRRPGECLVSDCMTPAVAAVRPSDDLEVARRLMMQQHISRVIVAGEDNELVGVISLSDLVQLDAPAGAEALRGVTEREAQPKHL